jgi:hypothetical protein
MPIIPFRWQGKARREEMRAVVTSRVQEWLRHWCTKAMQVEVVTFSSERPDAGRNRDRWHQLAGGAGTLSLRGDARVHEQLASLLAGVAASDSVGLAAGIGQRMLQDLASTLAMAEPHDTLSATDRDPAPQAVESRCGAVGWLLSLDAIQIELYLDATLCDALVPPRMPNATQPLTSRRQTIGHSSVTLDAVLDLGTAALADTQFLRPGEVLKTSIPLDALIAVRSESGATVLSGVLTMVDGHRGLRCVGN